MISIALFSSSSRTRLTSAGCSALQTKRAESSSQGTTSIFSPRSSFTSRCTGRPVIPTQAPTGSAAASRDATASGVPRALDDDLLRGLRGDAAEALAVRLQPEDVAVALVLDARLFLVLRPAEDLEEQLVADLSLDALLARLLQRDLVDRLDRILHLHALHDGQGLEHLHHLLLLV